ncbi:hypothetical protein DEO72_LG9g1321 [Vigna unguiculata]|uniref:Uncharacterized protein n=1 Tax=Vigna unguiculata TaxID=3917 RepID=A0A4D6MXR4_VIGUN|nr:hypothetical protein DEO72_LG9g1321 [Vigna unguiculata]
MQRQEASRNVSLELWLGIGVKHVAFLKLWLRMASLELNRLAAVHAPPGGTCSCASLWMNCLAAGSDPPSVVDVVAIFLNFGWIVSDVRRWGHDECGNLDSLGIGVRCLTMGVGYEMGSLISVESAKTSSLTLLVWAPSSRVGSARRGKEVGGLEGDRRLAARVGSARNRLAAVHAPPGGTCSCASLWMNCLAAGSDPPSVVDVVAIFLNFGWIVSDVRRWGHDECGNLDSLGIGVRCLTVP